MAFGDYEGKLKQEFVEQFGELTAKQLWVLTNFAKRVRLRARNNSAYNNLCNRLFPYAQFQQVTKSRVNYRTKLPETYPGLQITVKGEAVSESEDEGED